MAAGPTVSVMMPAYNAAAFLREAVESVLAQTLGDFELLIIDDGSRDGTLALARSFGDRRIRVVANPANLGEAATCNVCLALASGRHVAVMHSDDIALPGRFATQVACLDAHPDIDVCGSDMTTFGTRQGDSDVPPGDAEIKAMFLAAAANILQPTAMFRRSLVVERGLRFRPDLPAACDYGFWLDCLRAGARFTNVKRSLLRYRAHPGNTSAQAERMRRAVRGLRIDLIHDYFPTLSRNDAVALAQLFDSRPMTFDEISIAVAVGRRVQGDMVSRFGENRELLSRIVDGRINAARNALRAGWRQGAGVPTSTA